MPAAIEYYQPPVLLPHSPTHPTLSGKATAAAIRGELKEEVEAHVRSTGGPPPGLAVVLVGDRRDSATYVRMKKKACDEIGVSSFGFDFPEDVTQEVGDREERNFGGGGHGRCLRSLNFS